MENENNLISVKARFQNRPHRELYMSHLDSERFIHYHHGTFDLCMQGKDKAVKWILDYAGANKCLGADSHELMRLREDYSKGELANKFDGIIRNVFVQDGHNSLNGWYLQSVYGADINRKRFDKLFEVQTEMDSMVKKHGWLGLPKEFNEKRYERADLAMRIKREISSNKRSDEDLFKRLF